MLHYWLVFDRDGATEVFIQPAHALTFAHIKAALAGQRGELRESHELDAMTAKKLPATAVGRTLSSAEAAKNKRSCIRPWR
jgi:hypothetical protein